MGQKIKPEELIKYDPDSQKEESKKRMIDKFESFEDSLSKILKEINIKDQKIIKYSPVLAEIKSTILSKNKSTLENIEKTLTSLSSEISGMEFKHKTTQFKKLDREVFKLMIQLDDIDAGKEPIIEDKRKELVKEIHELFKIMDEKVDCKQQDCIICKTGIDLNDDNKNE
jgi:hypothetical protein